MTWKSYLQKLQIGDVLMQNSIMNGLCAAVGLSCEFDESINELITIKLYFMIPIIQFSLLK